ncbi:MAG: DNA polymerase III subunit alpha [Bacteroidales bacterium]|nr:DNA polymerase III subunit alpha [Bacteroidales bacterium]
MFLIFDTETTGLPGIYNAPVTDVNNWPRLVQLAWMCYDHKGSFIEASSYIIKPEGFTIPFAAEKIHGISTERALKEGQELKAVLEYFTETLKKATLIVGHNIDFDLKIVGAEFVRTAIPTRLFEVPAFCTKEGSTDYCAIPGGKGGKFKWPTLSELYSRLFGENFEEAHNAVADVAATARCFLEMVRLELISGVDLRMKQDDVHQFKQNFPEIVPPVTIHDQYTPPEKKSAETTNIEIGSEQSEAETDRFSFTHLHVHTQYSILDGASDIQTLLEKVKNDNMSALAITDHGNMFGVKEFHNEATRMGIKPILGCEVYVARRSRHDKTEKIDASGFHLVLLAKNRQGYQNLIKLVSYGWTEGYYYKPRIDQELLKQHKTGLIALTACLHGEIPWLLLHDGIEAAREAAEKYRKIFGEDFYFELHRHPSGSPEIDREVYENQVFVNKSLLELSAETGIKCVATNDVHFINKEDALAHDRLLCISTGKDMDDPTRMRYTHQEWLKTQQEMKELFKDVPVAIANTREVEEKVEYYELNSDPIMPDFPIPEGFRDAHEYLHFLTYQGANVRYPQINERIRERIDFELETISKMGYPGYFLIVWDVIRAAREMGVSVGPGRGSAAGSVVAYCLKITDIDPIQYDLLFERFLNPDRVSMPDIDIDFDEDGREKVLQYVVKKYGADRVAHVITFGTMAPKMAIRDVARVQRLDLAEADRLAKLIPDTPGTTFNDAYEKVPALQEEKTSSNELIATTLKYAEVLEGSVRQTGVHACGIIIGRDNLEEYIPICRSKDAELNVTQYEGAHIESVGMLKMDFLGLKTLSIIKDTLENIKISKNIEIDINSVPLDDQLTYELYSRGETTGLFQFESEGMKKYLKSLKPNRFEDLIAMNALYRPGPMDYIPSYINRKHGKEEIAYDIPEMEAYLKDTYGITVYQEQVMLLSQLLAGFSKGKADSLRKAMGKKIVAMMTDLQAQFEEGCVKNGHDPNIVRKIWKDWESFAHYAFNKSHSTCYAYISYQTAYLKAHYPAEFMAAVLSRNINDIKKIGFFMDECKRMGLNVLVPDVNESYARFTVNTDGNIRFGLAAIKGVGESAVEHIIEVRKQGGLFNNIYDLVERVNLTIVNKRCLEALAVSGGFDSFHDFKRYQYFDSQENGSSFIEQLIRYGNKVQSQNVSTPTLFGDLDTIEVLKPKPPETEEWSPLVTLNQEKEVIGIYLSAHPLDHFKIEMQQFCDVSLAELRDLVPLRDKELKTAGMVTKVKHATTKNGKPYGSFTIEDYTDYYTFTLFNKDYENFRKYMYEGYSLLLKGVIQDNTWKKPVELEFKIKEIFMLSSVRDELIHNIQIRIPIERLNDELVSEISEFVGKEKGNANMKVLVYDQTENVSVEMFSRYKKIALSNELFDYLTENRELEYRLY